MKYRKKPVVIEAEQFFPDTSEIQRLMNGLRRYKNGVYEHRATKTGFLINTLEGKHEVTPGDWIITGVKGEKYPCKPDIFEMTYEKVDDTISPPARE